MLKGVDNLTKRQDVHASTKSAAAAAITTPTSTTTSIATTCKAKSVEMKVSRSI